VAKAPSARRNCCELVTGGEFMNSECYAQHVHVS
jgi:hypothetical protein